jgi:hypothetical protein
MIHNYKIDISSKPQEELQLVRTVGSYNYWRIYFDSFEHEEERHTETITYQEEVVKTVTVKDKNGNDIKQEVIEVVERQEEVEVSVYESKYVEVRKFNKEEVTALDLIKELVTEEITAYDTSSDVNSFYLNNTRVWLDKDTRVGLMNSTTIQKTAGYTTTTLWMGTTPITLDCDLAIQMLGALEIYALDCFNKTAEHKKNVSVLETVSEVANYNYTEGYPEKLKFNL